MADNLLFKNIERTENLGRYLDEIKNYKILTPEEEYDLILQAKNGDESAKETLILSNQRYLFSLCKKFSTAYNVLDLVSIANEGFIEGIERFDPTRGFRLYTFAQHYALQKIKAYLINENLTVKKSNYNKTYSKVNTIKNKFFVEHGRHPQIEEIQEELKTTYGIVIKETCDLVDVSMNSINQSADDGETYYEESAEFNTATSSVNSYEIETEQEYHKALVATMLNTLTDREKIVIKKIFGLGCEPQEMDSVAKEMGMSKERIRQIKIEVCNKLKDNFSSYKKRVI
jgi:RNA polymerase primary sigma factor